MVERNSAARSLAASNPLRVRFDAFELDEADARLLRDGRPLALAPTPFALLCALARQPGSLLTKHALLDQVWGHQFVSDSVLKTAISDLRTVLGDDPRRPRFIETVSRRGYRFIAATATMPTASAVQASASASGSGSRQMPPFIGRLAALAALRRAWEAACGGRRAIVWIAGEPGIGKTTLIDHFVASLGDIACARGQCVEHYGAGEPYLPVLEALAELCRIDSTVPALLRSAAPAWLLQLPWLCTANERESLRRELAGVSPDRMLREAAEAFDRYAERRPVLLVTEDLHWSDRSTIQLIDYIARRRGRARLMWLASFRLAEVVAMDHPLNSLRHELRLHGLCEEIVLDPFSESEVADFVAQGSPALAGDEAFVRALHERTDGLPLFVAAVTSEVMARATQRGNDAAAPAQLVNLAVPENLAAIIDHYIAKLDSDERALLSAAAVCGVEFRVGTVSDVLERDVASTAATCDRLARQQVWLNAPRAQGGADAPEQPYSFRHALFRQVLYERTPTAARAQLHRKAGAALQRERAAGVPVAAGELAMHFERGRDPMPALRYYAEAADDALAHLSPAETMTLTERGLSLLQQAPEGTERDTLEIDLATLRGIAATHVLGIGLEAKAAFERAYSLLREVPQHRMLGRLLHGLGFVLCLRTDYAEALAVAERAEALSSATKDPALLLTACIVHGEVDQRQGHSPTARTWIERGLALAEPLDLAPGETFMADPQVTLLSMLGVPLVHLGLVEQARALLQQAHGRACRLGQPMARLVAIWYDALVEVRLGNTERVATLADDMRALVDEFALAQGRIACQWFRGWADARSGQPQEGCRRIREAYEENTRMGMLAGGSEVRGYAAEALLLAGDLDAARHELEEALQFANEHAERVYLPQLFLIEAAIARARGEAGRAQASVRRAVAEARAQEAPWLEVIALLELCKSDGATSKDRHALAALVQRLPEAADTTAVASARALLGNTKSH
jgi:DNA-binding winged helix-turn-helix (wHTH) protein/ATP/maltotriose-dependent transcriptional regulator MalT